MVRRGTAIREQKNPFPFPHSDSAIHYRTMIVAGQGGVWGSRANKRNVNPIGVRPEQLWDCPVYSIATGYQKVALAAGDEGLWESPFEYFGLDDDFPEVKQLSRRRSDKCNWMYGNIYGSSYQSGGFLAEISDAYSSSRSDTEMLFGAEIGEASDIDHAEKSPTEIDASTIFSREGFSWGIRNKICLHDSKAVLVSSYAPWSKTASSISQPIAFEFEQLRGAIVSASSAPFGAVLEFDERLEVILSDGTIETLIGEPINWRVFPNAKFYQNQLHAIYDDHLCVFSFNQDYFVNQATKTFGINPLYDRLGPRSSAPRERQI